MVLRRRPVPVPPPGGPSVSRRTALLGLADAAAVPLLGACGGGSAGSANNGVLDPNSTFRYVFVQNPSTFDPHRSANPWDMIFFRLVYDQLIMLDQNDDLAPQVATAWAFVDDGTALVLRLRDDVTFIDGTPLDASAVKANLDRARTLENGTLKGQLQRIESVDVVDAHTLRINLNGPGGDLPGLFTDRAGSLISPPALANPDLDQNPVGSGMARLVEYIPGQVSRYERNPDYWDPEAAKAAHYEIYVPGRHRGPPGVRLRPGPGPAVARRGRPPRRLDFEMLVPSLDDHRAVAEALVPMLAEVGLRASTRVIESPTTGVTFYGRQEGNGFPGMGAPFADPTIQYQASLPGQFANPWNTTTPEFQQAWMDALAGATREARIPAIHRMVEEEEKILKSFPLHAHVPPSAWTDKAVFLESYTPAYAPTFRGVGVTA